MRRDGGRRRRGDAGRRGDARRRAARDARRGRLEPAHRSLGPRPLVVVREHLLDLARAHPVVEGGQERAFDGAAQQALDAREVLLLLGAHEREHVAGGVGPAGPAEPMRVVLGRLGHVVVDHVRHARQIEAPSRAVARHQDLRAPAAQLLERLLALLLAREVVQHRGHVVATVEHARQAVGPVAAAREQHQAAHLAAAPQLALGEHVVEEVGLQVARHRVDHLPDPRAGAGRRRQVHAHRLDEGLLGEAIQLGGQAHREHQGLARLGQQLEQSAQLGAHPHAHHAVGLLEHQHLDVLEVDRLALLQLEQPGRGGHQDVHLLMAQDALLGRQGAAAEDHADLDVRVAGVIAATRLDVGRQLPGRDQDEAAQPGRGVEQARQDGDQVRAGLPRPARGHADEVIALEDGGDGLALDGGGFAQAGGTDALEDGLGQPRDAKVTNPP